jgi:hypothetical protein
MRSSGMIWSFSGPKMALSTAFECSYSPRVRKNDILRFLFVQHQLIPIVDLAPCCADLRVILRPSAILHCLGVTCSFHGHLPLLEHHLLLSLVIPLHTCLLVCVQHTSQHPISASSSMHPSHRYSFVNASHHLPTY